jgi:hypothetical protein
VVGSGRSGWEGEESLYVAKEVNRGGPEASHGQGENVRSSSTPKTWTMILTELIGVNEDGIAVRSNGT